MSVLEDLLFFPEKRDLSKTLPEVLLKGTRRPFAASGADPNSRYSLFSGGGSCSFHPLLNPNVIRNTCFSKYKSINTCSYMITSVDGSSGGTEISPKSVLLVKNRRPSVREAGLSEPVVRITMSSTRRCLWPASLR